MDRFPDEHRQAALAPQWLAPSAALQRYTPPERLLWQGPQEVRQRSRYGFRIGSLSLLIRADVGSEVVRLPAVSALPGSAPWLIGLMNLRGNLVPLFDLRLVLGLAAPQDAQARLVLILDKGDDAVGLVIDGFPQALLALHPIAQLPHLPEQMQAHVHAAFLKDQRVWLEFNHESFFDTLTRAGANAS